jgi:hypothetical protein
MSLIALYESILGSQVAQIDPIPAGPSGSSLPDGSEGIPTLPT